MQTSYVWASAMDGQWLSYVEAAARLGVSVEAVRQRAIRNKWARTLGNDKRARIRLPDEPYPTQPPVVRASDQALVHALESHIKTLHGDNETLKEQLAAADASLAAERARTDQAIAQGVAMVKAEQAQTEKAIAAFASLADRLDAMAAERAKPWWRRLAG